MEMLRLPEGLDWMTPPDCDAFPRSERQQMAGPTNLVLDESHGYGR
jgi:hypothetical protein